MAEITTEQKDRVSKFMGVFWNQFVKPFYNPPSGDDQYWTDLIRKADDIAKEFGADSDPRIGCMIKGFIAGTEAAVRHEDGGQSYEYIETSEIKTMLNMLFKDMEHLKHAYASAQRVHACQGSVLAAEVLRKRNES